MHMYVYLYVWLGASPAPAERTDMASFIDQQWREACGREKMKGQSSRPQSHSHTHTHTHMQARTHAHTHTCRHALTEPSSPHRPPVHCGGRLAVADSFRMP